MSDEKVTIAITSNGDKSIRVVTNEYDTFDTTWPHLVEVFLEQLQGLGYKFAAPIEDMVTVLDDYHQECICDGCREDNPVVEEKKYPYTGILQNNDGVTIVKFFGDGTGECVYTIGHAGNFIGQSSDNWDESLFEKVSK